jgi:apolipoprotein N-acyltransferase
VSLRRAFLTGWGAGTAWLFFSYNWITHSISVYGHIPVLVAEGAILIMAAIHGLYLGLFSLMIPVVMGMGAWERGSMGGKGRFSFAHIYTHALTPLLVLPSAWVVLEMVRCWFPVPFPWLVLGTALRKFPFSSSLYQVAGVYGASWWVVAVNVMVFGLATGRAGERRKAGLALAVFLAVPVMSYPLLTGGPAQKFRVAVVQGNFAQEVKWDESRYEETLNTYLSLTDSAVEDGAGIVVWPETAIPSYYQAEPEVRDRLKSFTSSRNVHLVFGNPGYEIKGREILLYNRVYHLSPDGTEEYYDKNVLVPFGEYVPLADLLPFIDKMVPGEGEFARGTWEGPFHTSLPSGALVCYEIAFPSLARREVSGGSRMLVNVTNDAWFGRTWGPFQHLAAAAVRAMENRVPVLRAANTGISAIIDDRGRIIKSIPLQERGYVVAEIHAVEGQTIYTRYGDWIVIFSAAVISVYFLVILDAWRQRKWTS